MQRIRGALNRLSLAQQFMLACFIVLVFGMLGAGWWVGQQIENGVISRTAGQTALYVDSFVDPPLQNIGQGVQLTSKDMAALDRLVQNTPLGQHIVAFKIWDTQGRVLYSTNPALIGQQFPVKDELARSFAGEVVADITDLSAAENALERGNYTRLLEIYSPVQQAGTNKVIAAVEFYQTVDALDSEVRAAQLSSWLVVGGATLLDYVTLAGLADRRPGAGFRFGRARG